MRGIALLDRIWYVAHPLRWLLWPLSWLFILLAALRRQAYRQGLLKSWSAPVPVIVVGNISVGGTGKTPFTVALCQALQARGWRPGIVSRGYGGKADAYPTAVTPDSDPAAVGDEPILLARRTGCPMRVDPVRIRAAQALIAEEDIDIIVSDDGLQHYALQRDLEIVIVDGERRHGNGMRLPAGPLREGLARLQQVSLVLVNGPAADEAGFELHMDSIRCVRDGASVDPERLRDGPVHAVAGIGHPQRFFDSLREQGLDIIPHDFADHHSFTAADLRFADERPVLMTEKDAVKCRAFAGAEHFYVPVSARLNQQAERELMQLIERLGTAPEYKQQSSAHG